MSRTIWWSCDWTMSTAPIEPPAWPIADVTSPSTPASFSKRIRRVRLNDALGVTGIDPALIRKPLLLQVAANHTSEGSTRAGVFRPGAANRLHMIGRVSERALFLI